MKSPIDSLDIVTIYAFLEALAQQDEPLPPDLKRQINEVGHLFTENPKAAANRLLDLAEYETIKPIYDQVRIECQRQYQPKTQIKIKPLNQPTSSEPVSPPIPGNIASILIASEPTEEAKKQSFQFKNFFSGLFRSETK